MIITAALYRNFKIQSKTTGNRPGGLIGCRRFLTPTEFHAKNVWWMYGTQLYKLQCVPR